jgi:DNA-binding MarR family transcriptional regulator
VPEDPSSVQASPARWLSQRAGFLLVQLGTNEHRRFAERLAPLDLHPRHFGMLSHLAAAEGQSQQALSIALGIHRSAVVALVDDLEQRGLAERRRDPDDRRAYTLYLTPSGSTAAPWWRWSTTSSSAGSRSGAATPTTGAPTRST